MSIRNVLRAALALSTLALTAPALASDASFDKLQAREAAPSPGSPLVAAAEQGSCSCQRRGDGARAEEAAVHERPTPVRSATPERPTTGIFRR